MMKKNSSKIIIVFLLYVGALQAQTNTLTGSPYSLFGLGVQSNATIGKNNTLGKGGIALFSEEMINIANPASFAAIPKQSFLLDIGFLGEFNSVSNTSKEDNRLSANFSNLAFAFRVNDKSGLAVSLIPYTDVGYSFPNIDTDIEGTEDTFTSNIDGSGGLNEIAIDYGYQLFDNFSVGLRSSYIFGSIDENEEVILSNSLLNINETKYYNGVRFGVGFQYQINKDYSIGFTTDLPTVLSGSQDRIITKTIDVSSYYEEFSEEGLAISNFKIPLEIGVGARLKPIQQLTFNVDYKQNLWGSTDQRDQIGTFKDQSIFSLGAEYRAKERGLKYWENVEFRAGFNYDSGYLKVNNQAIDNYSFSAGIGIPISLRGNSMLNISYTGGKRGAIDGILVSERFNMINLNLSLVDIWFRKIKFN